MLTAMRSTTIIYDKFYLNKLYITNEIEAAIAIKNINND